MTNLKAKLIAGTVAIVWLSIWFFVYISLPKPESTLITLTGVIGGAGAFCWWDYIYSKLKK